MRKRVLDIIDTLRYFLTKIIISSTFLRRRRRFPCRRSYSRTYFFILTFASICCFLLFFSFGEIIYKKIKRNDGGEMAGGQHFPNSHYLAISVNVERLSRSFSSFDSYTKAIAIMNSSSSSDNDGYESRRAPSQDQ